MTESHTSAVRTALVEATAGRAASQGDASVRPDGGTLLLAAGAAHGLLPALWIWARGLELPEAVTAVLTEAHRAQIGRHLAACSDLGTLSAAFAAHDIAWAVLKGPVLACTLWQRADARGYGDVDVLVAPERFSDALDAACDAGAELLDVNWELISRRVPGELSLQLPAGSALDLHWNVVNSAQLRRRFRFDSEAMLARTREVALTGVRVPTLDAVDTLLHLGYHTCHSGAHRLVWLRDVQLSAAAAVPAASEVVRRASSTGTRLTLAAALDRSRSVAWPTPTPPSLAVPMPAWLRLARRATERGRPVPVLDLDAPSGQLLYRSLRDNLRHSAPAGVARTIERLHTHVADQLGAGIGGEARNPLRTAAGGETARRLFLDGLAAMALPRVSP